MTGALDARSYGELIRVALHGAPRSGTTWLAEIFNSAPEVCYRHQPLFSYAFKGALTAQSDQGEISRLFQALYATRDSYVLQTEERVSGIVPDFPKRSPTHLIYKEVRYHHILSNLLAQDIDVKAVFVVRDPRAVIASLLGAAREFRRDLGWRVEDEWRFAHKKNQGRSEEFFGYEKWKEAAEIFGALKAEYPDRVYLLRYSELLSATEEVVRNLFAFCGLEYGEQTKDFLAGRVAGNPQGDYTVFRPRASRDEKWRATLPDFIDAEIRGDLKGSPLSRYLD